MSARLQRRVEIGRRGRRFTIEVPLETSDGFGGVLRNWQPGPRVWGAIELLTTMERVQAGRLDALVTHRVVLPFRDDVTPERRLLLGPRRFRVRSADDPDGRRASLVCLVEEIAA